MGEWSEYFEDFPEENPSNWIKPARALEAQQRAQKGYAQAELDAELKRIVEKHRQPKK